MYTDIPKYSSFYEAISYVTSVGIMTGNECGKFMPDQLVNCAEAFIIIHNYLNLDIPFSKLSDSSFDWFLKENPGFKWAEPYIYNLFKHKLVKKNQIHGLDKPIRLSHFINILIFSDPFLKQSNFFSQHSYRYDNESPKREIIADILYRADKLKADHTSSCISKSLSIGDYSTVLSIIKESRTSRSLFSPDLSRMACIILDSTPQYEPKHDILLRQIEYIYKLILHKHELQLKKTDSQFIYHYTSLNTLEKLSLGSKFRAYHVEYLNDPNEGKSINSLLQSFSIDKKYPDWNLLSIPLGIFIASFINDSENSLPMWSQYGNQYTGCRLAFSSKDIPCDLYSVIYEETELKEHIDQILQTLDSYQKELETPIDYNRDPVFIFAQDIFQLLSYIYKNPAFRHEREVRLLIFSDIESSFAENTIRSNEDFPRIFKEIDLPRVDKKVSNSPIAIKEIMLGPKVVKPTWVKLSLIQRGYPPSCIHENYVPLQ